MGDVLQFRRKSSQNTQLAYSLFRRAAQLDEDPETVNEAESLYKRAIAMDHLLDLAYTNLGNILFRREDTEGARRLWLEAVKLNPHQSEAQYNLGHLCLKIGDAAGAVPRLEEAIKSDSTFSDAYYNLALALEQLGRDGEAQSYWRKYIKLEPEGEWTEIAARHLK